MRVLLSLTLAAAAAACLLPSSSDAARIRTMRHQIMVEQSASVSQSASSHLFSEMSMQSLLSQQSRMESEMRILAEQRMEMFTGVMDQHIMSVMNPKNGQVGIEIELQSNPRVVAYTNWGDEHTRVLPVRYGWFWSRSDNDKWGISCDNEKNPLRTSKNRLDYWIEELKGRFGGDKAKTEKFLSTKETGMNAAMEIVTQPIDTDVEADQLMIQNVLRIWVKLLREYPVKRDSPSRCEKFFGAFGHARAADFASDQYICVRFETVRTEFNRRLKALDSTLIRQGTYPGISAYRLNKEDIQFSTLKSKLYFIFKKSAAADQGFNYAGQVNFGYPLANFASNNDQKSLLPLMATSNSNPTPPDEPAHNSNWKFSALIWNQVREVGLVWANNVVIPKNNKLTDNDKDDIRGFLTLFVYYIFNRGFMLAFSKGVNNIMCKTPLNDLIRFMNEECRKALATSFKQDFGGSANNLWRALYGALQEIYQAGGLEALNFKPLWQWPVDNNNVQLVLTAEEQKNEMMSQQEANGEEIIRNTFVPKACDRWKGETEDCYGVLTMSGFDPVFYERVNYGYPAGYSAESAVGKPVGPFTIRDRVAVLMESRPGGWPFNRAWTRVNEPDYNAMQVLMRTNLAQMTQLQTALISLSTEVIRRQAASASLSTATGTPNDKAKQADEFDGIEADPVLTKEELDDDKKAAELIKKSTLSYQVNLNPKLEQGTILGLKDTQDYADFEPIKEDKTEKKAVPPKPIKVSPLKVDQKLWDAVKAYLDKKKNKKGKL